ncbi:Hypothetical protein EHI5A_068520 [Entamoeba histolytica KU27]|uniref:Uncharacterized protein n=1 Tax=Entamoeba histolytica KU27 TaxID=885311 RepID=M2QBF9_ENTHI|nr:Hypothetical protein EHI5A_068520 [Entamoeba histolytica KU27]
MKKLFELQQNEEAYNKLLFVDAPIVKEEYHPPNFHLTIKIICIDGELIVDKVICEKVKGLLLNEFNKFNEEDDKFVFLRKPRFIIQSLLRPYIQKCNSKPLFIFKSTSEEQLNLLLDGYYELQMINKIFIHELIDWMTVNDKYQIPIDIEQYIISQFDVFNPQDVSALAFLYSKLQQPALRRYCFESYITINGISSTRNQLKESIGSLTAFVVSKILEGISLFPAVLTEILSGSLKENELFDVLQSCLHLVQYEQQRKDFVLRNNLTLLQNKITSLQTKSNDIVMLFLHTFSLCSQETEAQTELWNNGLYQTAVTLANNSGDDCMIYICIASLGAYCGTVEHNVNVVQAGFHQFIMQHIQSTTKEFREANSLIATETLIKLFTTNLISKEEKECFVENLLDFIDESLYIPAIVNGLQLIKTLVNDNAHNLLLAKRWFSLSRLVTRCSSEKAIIIGVFKICVNRYRETTQGIDPEEMSVYIGVCLDHIDDEEIISNALTFFQTITNNKEWCEVAVKNGLQLVVSEIIKRYQKHEMIEVCSTTLLVNIIQNNFGILEFYSMQLPEVLCRVMNTYEHNSLIQDQCGIVLVYLLDANPNKDELLEWATVCYKAALEFVGNSSIQCNSLTVTCQYLQITNDIDTFNKNGWIDIFEVTMKNFTCDLDIQYHGIKLLLYLLKHQSYSSEVELMNYFSITVIKCSSCKEILEGVCDCVLQLISPLNNNWKKNLTFLKTQPLLINLEKFSSLYNNDVPLALRYNSLLIYSQQINSNGENTVASTYHFILNEYINSIYQNDYILNASQEAQSVSDFLKLISNFDFDEDSIQCTIAAMAILSNTKEFSKEAYNYYKMVANHFFKTDNILTRKYSTLFFALLPESLYDVDAISNYAEAVTSSLLTNFQIAENEIDLVYITFISINRIIKKVRICRSVVYQFNSMKTINKLVDKLKANFTPEMSKEADLLLRQIQ